MKDKHMTQLQADALILGTAALWGSSFSIMKYATNFIAPMPLLFYRFFIAAILCLIFFGKKLKGFSKIDAISGIIIGLALSAGFVFLAIGVQFTTASNNAFITSSNVVLVPFIYWAVCRQRPSVYSVIAGFMMFVGLALMTVNFSNGFGLNKGDIITLAGAVFFAFHVVVSDKYSKKSDCIVMNIFAFITGAVVFFVFTAISDVSGFIIPSESLLGILFLGVVCTFFCFSLQLFSQKYTTASHAAVLLSLEAVFGTIIAVIFLSEKLSAQSLFGFAIMFAAVILSEFGENIFSSKHNLGDM